LLQIVQTPLVPIIHPEQVTGFIFIFSEMEVIHHGIKILGIELVQLLGSQATEDGVEAMFLPSFPLSYYVFSKVYNSHADHFTVE